MHLPGDGSAAGGCHGHAAGGAGAGGAAGKCWLALSLICDYAVCIRHGVCLHRVPGVPGRSCVRLVDHVCAGLEGSGCIGGWSALASALL